MKQKNGIKEFSLLCDIIPKKNKDEMYCTQKF